MVGCMIYLLVSQHAQRVYGVDRALPPWQRRDRGGAPHRARGGPGDTWTLRDVRAGGDVRLDAIGCKLSVDAVYEDPLAAASPRPKPRAARAKVPARRKRD